MACDMCPVITKAKALLSDIRSHACKGRYLTIPFTVIWDNNNLTKDVGRRRLCSVYGSSMWDTLVHIVCLLCRLSVSSLGSLHGNNVSDWSFVSTSASFAEVASNSLHNHVIIMPVLQDRWTPLIASLSERERRSRKTRVPASQKCSAFAY